MSHSDPQNGIVGFDPDAVLLRDPGLLLDPNFLAALHAELRNELGDREAELTLLQMGFLHGLQDAQRAVDDAFGEPGSGGPLVAPPLAIRVNSDARRGGPGIAMRGVWPESTEASARLSALGRPADPSCYLSAGYTSGWLSGTLDADILAMECSCSACGDESCSFDAREAGEWRAEGDPAVGEILDALPFDAFRAFVLSATRAQRAHAEAAAGRADADDAVVHIWGPVMVVPFTGGDEALRAIDLIGHDPAARDVSVVVVNLSGAVLDEGYSAVALEQLVDLVEAWGAEAIFAEVPMLAEPIVDGLERPPLVVHKDLAQAITAGFQIADAQRRTS